MIKIQCDVSSENRECENIMILTCIKVVIRLVVIPKDNRDYECDYSI